MMDEQVRYNKKISPPAEVLERWNQQMQLLRLFDQLIANTDRNLGNLLIGNDWTIWAIDHTRAFRTQPDVEDARQHDALRSCGLRTAEAARQADAHQGGRKQPADV